MIYRHIFPLVTASLILGLNVYFRTNVHSTLDGAKARSLKRSDGSLCCPTGESKLLTAQHEAGVTRPQAALTGPPTAALTAYL